MRKMIIYNNTNLLDEEVVRRVGMVIGDGLQSKTSLGPQYTFHTSWQDGIGVSAILLKSGTHRFIVDYDRR